MIRFIVEAFNVIKEFIINNYIVILIILIIITSFYKMFNLTIFTKHAHRISSAAFCQMDVERQQVAIEKEEDDKENKNIVPVKSEVPTGDKQFIDRF